MRTGRLDKAIADLDEAIRLDPNDAQSYANRAQVLTAMNQPMKALKDYAESLRLQPNDPGFFT